MREYAPSSRETGLATKREEEAGDRREPSTGRREEIQEKEREREREREKRRESFGAVKSVSRGQCQRLTLRGSWQA